MVSHCFFSVVFYSIFVFVSTKFVFFAFPSVFLLTFWACCLCDKRLVWRLFVALVPYPNIKANTSAAADTTTEVSDVNSTDVAAEENAVTNSSHITNEDAHLATYYAMWTSVKTTILLIRPPPIQPVPSKSSTSPETSAHACIEN